MPNVHTDRRTGLLLSGGVDSSVLLDWLRAEGRRVVPFYIRTGARWENAEFAALSKYLSAIDDSLAHELVEFDVPMGDVYGRHWSITGDDVPDDSSHDAAVYLPGRNPVLLVKPALWCQMHGVHELALATLANNPFDDATPEFFLAFEDMMYRATRARVRILRPFERFRKTEVMNLGRHLPLELTFSCLAPLNGMHCGKCNKCAERRAAFRQLRLADGTAYFRAVEPH